MKVKFNSFDVACIVNELQQKVQNLRVINVYDISNKSYIIKFGQEVKSMLFIESGSRIHLTAFEWPKQMMPSAFSAKCRKVMKNKRLTNVSQIGCDRIIDLTFGSEEFASHLIVELYDKGNICLCNNQYIITAILRTRQDEKEDIRYAIGHFYPFDVCQTLESPTIEAIQCNLGDIKPNTQLKRWLNFIFPLSIPLIEHCLRKNGLDPNRKIDKISILEDLQAIQNSLEVAHSQFTSLPATLRNGYVICKNTQSSSAASMMDEFHPVIYDQFSAKEVKEFPSYNDAIDVFFYEQETQKIEMKSLQQEKNAMKKLDNIKTDHENRIKVLKDVQEDSANKAYLIEVNLDCVEEAINTIQNLVANRLSWEEIDELVQEGRENSHQAALAIKKINLQNNKMTMSLRDIYESDNEYVDVEIDLAMGAYSNAKHYFDEVKHSALKEQKTIQSSAVALKNAEKKTHATIKDISIVTSIKKARKMLWFEKFLWFISSEGYIVIGGRDAIQNEILVKKYLKKNDVYVHADIHGATSIIVKNKSGDPLPPKTMMEAGCFALCHSSAWNSKIVTSAYWVHAEQVSKTAPTGEYLTTGSFMIRGKKNFLPPAQHILGFSILFKIDDESVESRRKIDSILPDGNELDGVSPGTIDESGVEETDAVANESDSIESKNVENENDVDDLFEKYNLQISAVPKPEVAQTEFTEYVGTAHNPHYKKKLDSKNLPQKQGKITPESKQASSKPKRRQKGKKKKMEKYADQSDDEREAKMALLGSAGTKIDKGKSGSSNSKLKYRATSTAKNVVAGFKPDGEKIKMTETERVLQTMVKELKEEVDNESDLIEKECVPEPSTVKEEEDSKLKAPKTVPPEEIDLSDNEDEPIDILDSLVRNPLPTDTILFGVPFVAPYNSMSSCKYRVKLTPGTTKKGKACKTILDLFTRDKNALLQEKNVFKSLKDVDMTVNIPGKVKVSAPNLHGHGRK